MLRTKYQPPTIQPSTIYRPQLARQLTAGLHGQLLLVSAPTGYGKTTLVADWIANYEFRIVKDEGHRHPSSLIIPNFDFGWLSLDEDDNDPARFLRYLAHAWRQINETIGHTAVALLQSPQPVAAERLLTSLINDIMAYAQPALLVLDDYHLITNEAIHQALTFLLDNLPPNLCLLIITRTEPPLPLARLRVRGQLTEITQADLRFNQGEIAAFFNELSAFALTPEQIAALNTRTEGWIAALQLVALSLRGHPNPDQFIAEFSGSHRHVVAYLAEEVLQQQPLPVQQFWQQTAVLDRLTAPLCDRLTGNDNSHQLLAYLEQNNLFLIPLDERRQWYRYHPLLADFLQQRLSPAQRAAQQRRAARWFAARQQLPEAIRYALAAQDESAADLIAQAAPSTLLAGEQATLRRWLAALPPEQLATHGELSLYQGWLLFQAGQVDKAAAVAKRSEALLAAATTPAPDNLRVRLRTGRLRCLQAWLALHRQPAEDVVEIAQAAAAFVAGQDDAFHVLALTVWGEAHEALGQTAVAVRVYQQAVAVSRRMDRPVATLLALVHLVITLNESGRRQEAVALCQEVRSEQDMAWAGLRPFANAIGLVESYLAYEANELNQAHSLLAEGLSAWQQLGIEGALLFGRQLLAQVQYAIGEPDAARQTAHAVRWQAAAQQATNYLTWAESFLQEMQQQQGEVTAVASWAETAGFSATDKPYPWQWPAYLTYARLLLDQKRPDEALTLLHNLAGLARRGGRNRALITVYLLQASAHADRDNEAERLVCLKQALQLAAGEGYIRAFLDEGDRLLTWLDRLRPRLGGGVEQEFVGRVLRAWHQTAAPAPATQLIEPLTEREMEVLQLLVSGRSNPEIADLLFVSLNTVKWHLKNIYGKLQVSNRVEAVTRAQSLGLTD